ncbi:MULTISPECIES: HAD family hydrolase [unclassified Oleiphilus]|uniref:HAD family hydrolase n=2 Tax=Oleiphilus TaxID=141450 RepID=UPI0007C2A796|nr:MULTISPECIES: Cof-type HAD-IIB family hydrolase [unclassified Oleiphilus]KZY65350.1 haloacid dehalogenase [Oleiphilus sp. HI0066]KZY68429.1 haloacid dehalogenase [Oleiphilus sp. HI0067]KZY68657.1 haloacid dehalogenase [Oleiphilus sp. HI0066]
MDLVFFDLDGTLLNKSSEISAFTLDTLQMLKEKGIAHTLATGRTMSSAQQIIHVYDFDLPHIYCNGVALWDPKHQSLTLDNLLSQNDIDTIVDFSLSKGVAPFINTIDSLYQHTIFYPTLQRQIEKDLVDNYYAKSNLKLRPLSEFETHCRVTNISMIGDTNLIQVLWQYFNEFDSIVAYSGTAIEGDHYSWMDVHHRLANKGSAVKSLKEQLGASNVICFGDSYNDETMFNLADECYAPENAKTVIKKLANEVIGHHHQDGVAHFLRERFSL